MKKFNSFLSPLIKEYVDYQKASEHWNEASYEPNLLLFDRYCQKQYPDTTRIIIHADPGSMLWSVSSAI